MVSKGFSSLCLYAHFHVIPHQEYGGGEVLSDAGHPTSWKPTSRPRLNLLGSLPGLVGNTEFPLKGGKVPRGGLSSLAAGRVAGTGQGGPRRPGGCGGAGGEGPEVTEAPIWGPQGGLGL